MNCELALERMLDADPEELEGRGDSELVAHIQGCGRCQAVAAELLAGHEMLAAQIHSVDVGRGVERVLPAVRRASIQRVRRRRLIRFALPAAAAAVLALLAVRGRAPSMPLENPSAQLAGQPPAQPIVRLAPNTNALVIETNNPKITVLWFY